jgi:hypothetical protein
MFIVVPLLLFSARTLLLDEGITGLQGKQSDPGVAASLFINRSTLLPPSLRKRESWHTPLDLGGSL